MSFWKNYCHLVWATKYRQAIIDHDRELLIFSIIHRFSQDELGSKIFALNGVSDHIHVAVAIPPKIAVSAWVKRVKGVSSNAVNKAFVNENRFAWQIGFGCSTFGYKQLGFVMRYIEKQKEHHAKNTSISFLERSEDDEI